jgi:transposase
MVFHPGGAKMKEHLQGKRGEEFLRLVQGVPREKIIGVSIDVHKYYHLVLIHDGYGRVLIPSFSVDIFQTGFAQLCQVIDETVVRADAELLLIGMEPTGHYFENLARHLLDRYPHVRLVNSYAVKQNRNQKMLRAQKDDEIDLAAIGDLLLRNESFPFQPLTEDYLRLQHWVRFRKAKVKSRTALRNQVIGHLDRIFPGLVRPNKKAQGDHPSLFGYFWGANVAQQLIRLCPNPRLLARMSVQELIDRYHARGWRMGPINARRIIAFAQQVLWPDPEVIEARLPLLEIDLALLDGLDAAIAQAEEEIAEYLSRTRGHHLADIKGLSSVQAAGYVAGMGNPELYRNAGQVFKRSGLVSGRNDSGIRQRQGAGRRVTKVGDPHLRDALVQLTRSVALWQPYFGDYKAKLKKRGKHAGVATVATARKVNGVLFALMRDQSDFHPTDAHGNLIPPRNSTQRETATDMDSSKT